MIAFPINIYPPTTMTYLINFTAIAAVIYFGIAFVGFASSYDFEKAQVSQASPKDIEEPEDLEEPPGITEASSTPSSSVSS